MTWLEVDQSPRRYAHPKEAAPVRLSLKERNGISTLWVTITNDVAAKAGWQIGTTLGIAIGQDKFDGWLRILAKRNGRCLKRMGKSVNFLTVSFIAPEAWQGLACESTEAEEFRPRADELLIQIPWDFSEVETGPAGHEVAA